jgi:hypothetical protein
MKRIPSIFGCFALAALLAPAAFSTTGCSSSSVPNAGADSGDNGSDAASGMDVGASHDTWNSFGKTFFATYCVECHNATIPDASADPKQNFNIYSDVTGFDKTIRCGVAPAGQLQSGCPTDGAFPPPGQFPISDAKGTNPKPSDAERLRIIAWINAGAPEN